MARRTTIEEFASLVTLVRSSIPGVAITTDIIVGFPGESQREFQEGMEFIKSLHLAGGHVFTYSERPGTPAARLDERVPHRVRKTRSRAMRKVLREMSKRFRQKHLGTTGSVLWEGISGSGPDGFEINGWTDNHLKATYVGPENLSNQITSVLLRVTDASQSSILVDLI
jgi:threonylcarbamoyladenosine tRNA methylthiotransferase MtaB